MKKIMLIIFIVVLLVIGFYYVYNVNKTKFELDNSNKYIIVTDNRWTTMMNDGGSNTNIYYEIDLDNDKINKVTESYKANLGSTPKKSKNSITIKIDHKLSKELSTALNKIFQTKDINNSNNYNFYTIKRQNEEKEIYNEDTIKILKELIDKIENEG